MTIWKWSAVETARRIKDGDISCEQVVQSHLTRLDEVNPRLNAVVVPLHEQSLAEARRLDRQRRPGDALPPLFGVPVTTKINMDLAGQANSDGVPAYRNNMATDDAPVIANLRQDGAIVIGLTNTPEFSIRWFTSNPLHGVSLNPWNPDVTPGGSSGAAVAAGIGCIAHGNDMGGSLRHPAYCCGVSTIRPSFGRIANGNPSATGGRPPMSQLLSVQGPIARSVADVRLGLASMARYSAFDADWSPARDSGRGKGGVLRIAYQADPFGEGVSAPVLAAMEQAKAALQSAGHRVEAVTLPDARQASNIWGCITLAEVDALQRDELERHGSAEVVQVVDAYRAFFGTPTLTGTMQALMERNRIRRAWSQLLEQYDLVLMPVSAEPAFANDLDMREPNQIPRMLRAQRFLLMINALGLPAAAVPTGLHQGVPMGVQLVGAPLDDALCLQGAQAIEDHCGTLSQALWQQGVIAR
ncbi:amidase [Oceanimonas sp. MB9]|uniref:amidase n=1 Tax=Oceanimonas sp. MB9 TaxID=2588453 RepID=UPI0013F5F3B7|nr:amidase [Oceanimonas sp. MB9]NHI01582.1 Glutamyl-tRNA(Gln) amidotransferase subunit A [Oceanimonas sp. MB9]